MIINQEDDVRAWVREASEGKARWIEPALGSTAGLPDCWVPVDGRCVHLELKCGWIKKGELRFTVRPEQKRELLRMVEDGVPVGLLVGVKGTNSVVFLTVTEDVVNGAVSLAGEGDRLWKETESMAGGFWAGVNFIVLNNGK